VVIRTGTFVDNISTQFTNGSTAAHGGGGGDSPDHVLLLDNDEVIIGISGQCGTVVDSIRIHTNKKNFGPFGGNGGRPFQFMLPPNLRAVGFFGGSGSQIDRIGIIAIG
jgi:hypothetical protein